MTAVLMRMQNDKSLACGSVEHLQKALESGEQIFSSSAGLMQGGILLDAYLGPLLGALSPAIWSFAAFREFGAAIFSLGRPIAGTAGEAAELLQTLPHQGPTEGARLPKLSPSASSSAIGWWNTRLNEMFGVLTDVGVFSDANGLYHATKHIHGLATVEQLFRRVGAIQVAHRDRNARLVLLFTVLDTLERLTGRPLEGHCTLSFATKTLDKLRSEIPDDAAEILLPAAERAVAALEGVQEGFFIRRQLGAATVDLIFSNGAAESLTPEKAASEYVKILRNATHGHGSNRATAFERTNALLAHHDGRLPHDLGLLGYLYLLDVLAHPDNLRTALYRSGRVDGPSHGRA